MGHQKGAHPIDAIWAPVMYANLHLLEMGITESRVPFFVDHSEAKRTKILFPPCQEKCEIIPDDSQISRDIICVSQQRWQRVLRDVNLA